MRNLFFILFFIPLVSFADGTTAEFCAVDFGTTNVNGTYVYVDSSGGNFYSQMPERYGNENGFYIYTIPGSSSILLDSSIGDASPNYYYKNFVDAQNGDYTEIAGSWNIENLGANPAGTVSDCTPVGGGSATSTFVATSTFISSVSLFTLSFLFWFQLFAILLILYFVIMSVGYPIKVFWKRIMKIITY